MTWYLKQILPWTAGGSKVAAMTVYELFQKLKKLVDEGRGDLPLYTEYERVETTWLRKAAPDDYRDGCSLEVPDGEEYVEVQIGH